MSSRKAEYESSMLCVFGPDDEFANSGFTAAGAAGLGVGITVEREGFGFGFKAAVSLLTRTDAGT